MAKQNLGQYIAAKVRQAINQALQDNKGLIDSWFKDAASGGGGGVTVNLDSGVGSLVAILTDAVLGSLVLGPELLAAQAVLHGAEGQASDLGKDFGIGYLLASVGFQIVQPAFDGLVADAQALFKGSRLDASTAAAMWSRGIMTQAEAQDEGLGTGFAQNRTTQLYQAALTFPDLNTALELWRRNLIGQADFELILTRHGYSQQFRVPLEGLSQVLLAPAELALANLRGFMDSPTAFAYAQKLGVDATDFQTMIDNTGEPPGLSDMLAMYRRGIIDQSRLEHGIRESRVRNEWIPFVEAYRYHPMSAADAVGARVKNYIDDATAKQITEQNGVLPEHYSILRDSYGRPLSRTEMTTLFHRGLASEADFKQAIRETDTKDSSAVTGFNYIDGAFELSRQLIPVRQIILAIQHGAITRDQALQRILIEGYSATDAAIILDTGLQEKHAALKELTASEITALYIDRIMTREEAHAQLVKLTYTDHMADLMLDLARFKADAKLARIVQTGTKALYLKKDITRAEALKRLQEGGTAHQDAVALIDEWELTKHEPLRRLSESQIVKAAKDGVISIQQAGGRLLDLGYDQRDAIILLQDAELVKYQDSLNNVDLPIPASTVFTDTPEGHPGGDLGGGGDGGPGGHPGIGFGGH